jgi:hypothetical protein
MTFSWTSRFVLLAAVLITSLVRGAFALPPFISSTQIDPLPLRPGANFVATIEGSSVSGGFLYIDYRPAASILSRLVLTQDGSRWKAEGSVPMSIAPKANVDLIAKFVVLSSSGERVYKNQAIVLRPNAAPSAVIGPVGNAVVGNVVILDGSPSSDPDNDSLTYSWSILSAPSGSTALLENPSSVRPTFTPDLQGSYRVQLRVSDGVLTSALTEAVIDTYPVVGQDGGVVKGPDGISAIFPAGSVPGPTTVILKSLGQDGLPDPLPPFLVVLGGVSFDIGNTVLSDNADLSIPKPADLPNSGQLYLVRVVNYAGKLTFTVVDTAQVVGNNIVSQDPPFPGVLESGDYVFVWFESVSWVEGRVYRNEDNSPVPNAVATLSGGYFLDIADSTGHFTLPAPAGNFVVVGFDPISGDFGEKPGFIASLGTTVVADVGIGEEAPPPPGGTLINGDFETGDLTGWTVVGEAGVIAELGSQLSAPQGGYMGYITSGGGAEGAASSGLEQSFQVPTGTRYLLLSYNVVSEEYPEYVGTEYNDVFNATLFTPSGQREIVFADVNGVVWLGAVNGVPDSHGSGDLTWGQTGWRTVAIDVSDFAGTDDTLTLTVHDVGDTIYTTIVLLDSVRLSNEELETVPVPNVVGMGVEDARAIINEAGLIPKIIVDPAPDSGSLPSIVYEQNPTAGTEVLEGAVVAIHVYGEFVPENEKFFYDAAFNRVWLGYSAIGWVNTFIIVEGSFPVERDPYVYVDVTFMKVKMGWDDTIFDLYEYEEQELFSNEDSWYTYFNPLFNEVWLGRFGMGWVNTFAWWDGSDSRPVSPTGIYVDPNYNWLWTDFDGSGFPDRWPLFEHK